MALMAWTLLKISPEKQNKYCEFVQNNWPNIEFFVPTYQAMRLRHGILRTRHGVNRAVLCERPVYPGYVFVRPDIEAGDHYRLIHTPIRAWFVRFGPDSEFEVVPDRVIGYLREMVGRNELVPQLSRERGLHRGDRVVVSLPNRDIEGIVVRLIAQQRAEVDTQFCRMTVAVGAVRGL